MAPALSSISKFFTFASGPGFHFGSSATYVELSHVDALSLPLTEQKNHCSSPPWLSVNHASGSPRDVLSPTPPMSRYGSVKASQ